MGQMIKLASSEEYRKDMQRGGALLGGLGGAALGGIAGNIQGRLSYKGKNKEEKKKHVRSRTAMGVLGGGALGAGGGHIGLGKSHDFIKKHDPAEYDRLYNLHMDQFYRK